MKYFRYRFRKFIIWLNGPPVCDACGIYRVPCMGRCGKSNWERIAEYVNQGE